MSTSLSVVGRLPTALSSLNTLTHLARSMSGQWRVDRQSVCREGSPSIHTQLEQLFSASWCLPPGSLSYGHSTCPPSLIQRLSHGEEIRNQVQDEQLPASQYGWYSVFIGETTIAISICNHHKAPKEKQEKAVIAVTVTPTCSYISREVHVRHAPRQRLCHKYSVDSTQKHSRDKYY